MATTQFVHERNAQVLAEHVQAIARPEFDTLDRLPYNRFNPEESTWWLVPSHSSPAYRNTKFIFGYYDDERRSISVGIHGEKGLSPALRELYPGKKGSHLIMDANWHWPTLCRYLVSTRFEEALLKASENLSEDILLNIYAGYVQDITEFDPYSPLREQDSFHYKFDPARRTWVDNKAPHIVHGVLKDFTSELDANGLARQLDILSANDWIWVDLYVISPFIISGTLVDDDSLWTAERIWNDYLHYLAFMVG